MESSSPLGCNKGGHMGTKAGLWVLVLIVAGGCAVGRPPAIQLASAFFATEAREMLEPGTNTITGSAFIRQPGGGTVTCAGSQVTLIPATAYATERLRHIYGSEEAGYRSTSISGELRFEPDYSEYSTIVRTCTADAQGEFEFDAVGDGEFYVVASVAWMVGSSPAGGYLMQRVRVSGGETKKITLSP